MTQQGATLQNYNNELVKCIEDLREKREEVNRSIAKDEEEKAKIQNDLRILTERLARINDNLARKITSRNEYDKTIQETEAAYSKVRRSSSLFLVPVPPPRCRAAASRVLTFRCFAAADHGVFANAAARPQARERQPHQEEAGLVVEGPPLRGGARAPATTVPVSTPLYHTTLPSRACGRALSCPSHTRIRRCAGVVIDGGPRLKRGRSSGCGGTAPRPRPCR